MPDLEGPSVRLAAGVLAGNAVEPALDAAGEPKVGRVDREHEPAVEDTLIEPLGQDELDALAAAPRISEFLPFVEPGELLPAPVLAVTDRGLHDGGLKPLQRPLEELVLAKASAAAGGDEELVRRETDEAGGAQLFVGGLDDLRRSPDQHIGIPDGRHAEFRNSVDLHLRISGFVENRLCAFALRERKERALHQIALVARADAVVRKCDEGIERCPLAYD